MSFWKKKNQENAVGAENLGSDPSLPYKNSVSDAPSASKAPIRANATSSENAGSSVSGRNSDIDNSSQSSYLGSIQQQDNTYTKVRSALSAGTVIQGKLSFDTPVRIDGKLSGEVYSSKVLIVGETAQINADIEASSLVIMGKVKGTISASEGVQLCSGSSVEGNIKCPSLIIDSGAIFNGSSEMTSLKQRAAISQTAGETKIFSNEDLDLEKMLNKSQSKDSTVSKDAVNKDKKSNLSVKDGISKDNASITQ